MNPGINPFWLAVSSSTQAGVDSIVKFVYIGHTPLALSISAAVLDIA